MSICYFKCDKCYREYSSSFFQEIRCSCGGWYLREYWKCMLGHKNDKADYGYPCAKCRKEAESKYNDNFEFSNSNRTKNNNDEAFATCDCFGASEEKKEEEEACVIF